MQIRVAHKSQFQVAGGSKLQSQHKQQQLVEELLHAALRVLCWHQTLDKQDTICLQMHVDRHGRSFASFMRCRAASQARGGRCEPFMLWPHELTSFRGKGNFGHSAVHACFGMVTSHRGLYREVLVAPGGAGAPAPGGAVLHG